MRDIVAAHDLLRRHLGIARLRLGIGGSMGGQQALEWACAMPDLFGNLVLLATNARHSPWGIACNEAQRMALEADGTLGSGALGGGAAGLEAARAIAMLTYRGYGAFGETQSDARSMRDGFAASSYLRHQGRKLADRFDPLSYWTLTKAMDSHDVGRDRGSVAGALARIRSRVLVAGIHSDILFPPAEQEAIARAIPGARMALIESMYGHDGFLVESAAIESCAGPFLHDDAGLRAAARRSAR
jgi:homoserine O-acetyltransferase